MLKKILPWIAGMTIGGILIYLIKPGIAEKVDAGIDEVKTIVQEQVAEIEMPEILITEETDAEKVYCPEIVEVECPPVPKCESQVRVETKIVYRDRIVHVPVKPKPGCSVNWQTREVTAFTNSELNLKCHVNWAKKDLREYFYESRQMPLRRARRP